MREFKRVTGVGPPLRILHLHLEVGQQSEANQFLYPSRHNVSVATFFPCRIEFPERIPLFDGDGTFSGFRRALRVAEENGPYDIVHPHGPIDGVLYLLFCHLTGRRLGRTVYSAHNSYLNFRPRNRLLTYPCFRFFDRAVCVSESSRASFPRRFQRAVRSGLSAVANGVDLDRLDATLAGGSARSLDAEDFRVASVGRIIEIKNPMTLLEAFSRVVDPTASLTFIGNGDLEEPVREAAKASDPRVVLTGELAREEVFRFLHSQADLYVSTSRGEGLPMAPLEAMASGCPVVLSDIAPHREIAAGRDFIPLVSPDDAAGFAQAIDRFRAMSPKDRREVGARCRGVVEERFSLQGMHDGYDRVYYGVLGRETDVVDQPGEEPTLGPPASVS